MGNQAYRKVKKDFNMDKVVLRYAEALKEIKCKGPTSHTTVESKGKNILSTEQKV
jgi:hypothetical protein